MIQSKMRKVGKLENVSRPYPGVFFFELDHDNALKSPVFMPKSISKDAPRASQPRFFRKNVLRAFSQIARRRLFSQSISWGKNVKMKKKKKSSFASRYVFIAVTRDHLSISARAIIFWPHALFAFFIYSIHCWNTWQNIRSSLRSLQ